MTSETNQPSSLLVLTGPTGVGKSALAVELAARVGGEIVNFDSVQVYEGFDIGSAKPDRATRARVPHHLIDVARPEEHFHAAEFAERAAAVCESLFARGVTPILVGGTGFYLRALLAGLPAMPGRHEEIRQRLRRVANRPSGPRRLHRWLSRVDPRSGDRIAVADRHRVERALEVWIASGRPISEWERPAPSAVQRFPARVFALTLPRPVLNERLDRRVELMYESGLLAETRELLERHSRASRPFTSIGYAEAVRVLDGEIGIDQAIEETRRRTRAYAKRQMTWLRGERDVEWIDMSNGAEAALARILGELSRA